VAVTELRRERAHRSRRLERLRDRLVAGVRRDVPGVVVTGEGVARLPGLAHFCFPGCAGDLLLMLLDEAGIACSAGSACAAGVTTPNRVLAAIGLPDSLARGAVRCSLGWNSTTADVDAAIAAMGPAVARATPPGALA
ncbi:MAG: aminotransferase class V-fold PLP-dependent enzyme, partial [Mycobacteriales bacterium]